MKFIKENKKKTLFITVIVILFSVLTAVFYSFPVISTYDTALYYNLSELLKNFPNLEGWNGLRGFTFPLILFLIKSIFGNSMKGLLTGMFLFYLLLIFFSLKIIIQVKRDSNVSKGGFVPIVLLIAFNTIIIGYYHVLLTEFVMTTLAMIYIYISYKWINIDIKNKNTVLKYALFYAISLTFTWFLKQPFILLLLVPMVLSSFLSLLKAYSFKNLIIRVVTFFFALFILLFSNFLWDYKLKSLSSISTNEINNNYFTRALVSGITNYRFLDNITTYDFDLISNDKFLTDDEKKKVIKVGNGESKYKDYIIFGYMNPKTDKIMDKDIILLKKEGTVSLKQAINHVISAIKYNPLLVLDSYYVNYLGIVDYYQVACPNAVYYYVERTRSLGWCSENRSIGSAIYNADSTLLWKISEGPYLKYYQDNPQLDKKIVRNNYINSYDYSDINDFFQSLFTYLLILMPILFIIFLIKSIVDKFKNKNSMVKSFEEMIILLSGTSYIYILSQAVLGAIIDRYAFPVYPLAIICVTLVYVLILNKFKIIKLNINNIKQKSNVSKNKKVLVIIPAYNEEENIGKVLDELKKDCPKYNILVINDCSKDSTKNIVKSKGVKCITHPYNMGYAKAVQTGIKYANKNDYDCVIQFDADGQHIAKEAKKLMAKMEETKSDIVIGTRFLDKTKYKHGFFRKIGTKLFSYIIKIFSNVEITDPTSGFQVLGRRVIERYSKIGNYPEFPDANLLLEMLLEGYLIVEMPIEMRQREHGESMHGGIIKPIKYVIKMLYALMIVILKKVGINRGDKNEK